MTTSAAHDSPVIRACGRTAFLVELPTLAEVLALHAELIAHPLSGQMEVLAAARTLMVRAATGRDAAWLADQVAALHPETHDRQQGPLIEIEVCYDGPDLDRLATLLGWSRDAVITAHTGQLWTAAFGGFAPGFTYCVAHRDLDVPRRRTPRTAVPAGSVGLAGAFSAVYPRTSPGGWQLIGRTAAALWDAGRDSPALIAPGTRVRYRAVRDLVQTTTLTRLDHPDPARGLRILTTGPQSLITDLGRPGHADVGVAESGAMDRGAARLANSLVGNPVALPVVENLGGGLRVQAVGDQMVAVTGARVPLSISADARQHTTAAQHTPTALHCPHCEHAIRLLDGQVLALGVPEAGLRSYLAVRGGVDAPGLFGSAATDLMSGIGPSPLRAGQLLAVSTTRWASSPQPGTRPRPLPASGATVGIMLGPRDDWFTPGALASLLSQQWRLREDSNRIGLRLDGAPLERSRPGELVSEGTVAGAVQVTTAGTPVILMRDHPVTGGYPVIGVVEAADLDTLAQLPAGSTVRFERSGGDTVGARNHVNSPSTGRLDHDG